MDKIISIKAKKNKRIHDFTGKKENRQHDYNSELFHVEKEYQDILEQCNIENNVQTLTQKQIKSLYELLNIQYGVSNKQAKESEVIRTNRVDTIRFLG